METLTLFILGVLNAMTPILLTALGEILAERAGVVNIGLEGIIMIGALVAVMAGEAAHSPWIGLAAGTGVGAAIGLLHAILTAYLKGDHIIPGVGINTLALGLVPFTLIVYWHSAGHYQVPSYARVPHMAGLSPITLFAIVLSPLLWYLLFKTPTGLKIRSVGENPEAADTVGVRVERTQALAVIAGASLAGLAGAYMSLDWLSTVTKEIAAGRGFIALALVVFSNWNPLRALGGAALFGFFDTLREWVKTMPAVKAVVPDTLLNTIPYIVTLAAVAGVLGKVKPPRHVGIPYKRE
ncbi:ABC transporter permease [Hyperthermus butylicus]|uniref:ABC transporter n=1 Tax=Hyperthermus butylicus (strain DSM 5456 / JCM 9403 / PLM1-5) TaxID=415426 RepID=A2BMM8_HYPBU|nr:ABC transporter permease [Hyperthermus butylicus]ABM81239.1 putative ABC transporter [Hyperthermus butylicus DSM 5456]